MTDLDDRLRKALGEHPNRWALADRIAGARIGYALAVEDCIAIAEKYVGQPVDTQGHNNTFENWARHGERMSACRIRDKLRALLAKDKT